MGAVGFVSMLAAGSANAQSMAEFRTEFMVQCVQGGEAETDCACIFDAWSSQVAPEDVPTARIALNMYLGEQPADMNDMMAGMQMMQGIAGVAMQCALGGQALPEGFEIPGLNMQVDAAGPATEELAESDEADMAEETDAATAVLEQMMRLQEMQDAENAEREAERQAQQEQEQLQYAALQEIRAQYEMELARIHSRDINDWDVADFEPLYRLYCESGGSSAQECACAWPLLADLSTYNAIPYLASRSEGDDVQERVSIADSSAAFFTHREFHQRKEALCE